MRIVYLSFNREIHVRRRLRKKRRSGFGGGGHEVTSGFDRHRIRDSDSESEESENDRAKSSSQSRDDTENLRKQLERERKAREEAEKKVKNEREKNSKLTQEMKDCIKTFYPTSWKENKKYAHNKIDAWDYGEISKVSDVSRGQNRSFCSLKSCFRSGKNHMART